MADDPTPDDTEHAGSRLGMAALVLSIAAAVGLAIALAAVAVSRIEAPDRAASGDAAPTSDAASSGDAPVPSTAAIAPGLAPGVNSAGWPAGFDGAPLALGTQPTPGSVDGDAPPGVYVWSDFDGWHVWVVNGADVAGVRGRVDSDRPLARADSAEPGVSAVALDGASATFELPAEPRVAGMDLGLDFFAENLVVTLEGAAGPLAVELVATGVAGTAPEALPLVIQKAEAGG